MPIDLVNEQAISIAFARRQYLPKVDGRPISPGTGYRWVRQGILAANGTRVRLEAAKVGRSLYTTKEAVDRFLREIVRHSQDETPHDLGRTEITRAKLMAEGLLKGSVNA